MIELAEGTTTTASETNIVREWLLCTWDPAYRLELVANDTRVDRLGVDVELMSAPWYAETSKNISAMYACCSYGKQHEELLETSEHLGRKWYAMVKFCETRFAQSELKVYIDFENNYITYCGTWGVAKDEEHASEERVEEVHHPEDSDSADDDLDEPSSVLVQRELEQQHQQRQQQQQKEQQQQQHQEQQHY